MFIRFWQHKQWGCLDYSYDSPRNTGEDPELELRDLAVLRSQTFSISSYPFVLHNTVELRYAKLFYGLRYDTLRYATLYVTMCSMICYATIHYAMQYYC